MSDVKTHLPPSPGGYDVDLPCASCGYNLRGLELTGTCPECGRSIAESVESWKRRLRNEPDPITLSNPIWVKTLAEGAGLMLCGFVLIVILAAAPESAYRLRTKQREFALGIACGAWVLCWYGAWKLTTPEPMGRKPWPSGALQLILRTGVTLYLFEPFIALVPGWQNLYEHLPRGLFVMFVVVEVAAIIAAGALYYPYLVRLVRRLPSRVLTPFAIALALFNVPVFFVFLLPQGHGYEDSLGRLMSLPTIAYGSPIDIRYFLHSLFQQQNTLFQSMGGIVDLAALIIFISAGFFHLMLVSGLRNAAKIERAERAIHLQSAVENVPNSRP